MNQKQRDKAELHFRDVLITFKEGEETVLRFEAGLNKIERAIVHDLSEQMDFMHFSEGKGSSRHIVVWKHPPILFPGVFDREVGEWIRYAVDQEVDCERQSVSIVTYNVLFDMGIEYTMTDLRRVALLEVLETCEADIIALQEVTPDLFEDLKGKQWVRDMYYISDYEGSSITPSGNLLMSKFPFNRNFIQEYSKSPKTYVLSEFIINGRVLSLGNLHLKSGSAKKLSWVRKSELQETISSQLKLCKDDSILLGDFNMRDANPKYDLETDEKIDVLEDNYDDVWKMLHPDDKGHTFDIETNTFNRYLCEQYHSDDIEKVCGNRFDRIYINKSDNQSWNVLSCEMIFCQPIGKSELYNFDLFISDHFGLKMVLQLK